jgi:hypothetical protein
VLDYLSSAGYGPASEHFGKSSPVLSSAYWTRVLHQLVNELYLPGASLVAVCLLAGVALAIRSGRSGLRSLATSNVLVIVLVVLEGYLALTSSRNEGTAFSLPWLPALVVLALAVAARVPSSRLRAVLAALFVALGTVNLLMKSGLVPLVSANVVTDVPGIGTSTVLHGKGIVQDDVVEASGYAPLPATKPFPSFQKRWLPFERELVVRLDGGRGGGGSTPALEGSLATASQILTNTSLNLAAALEKRNVHFSWLRPYTDAEAAYRSQLIDTRVRVLLTAESPSSETDLPLTIGKVEGAARSLGFRRIETLTLPDGRRAHVWSRGPGNVG